MTTHTPGPWVYRVDPDLDDNISGPNSEQLARVYCTDTLAGRANAHLIATAPELLTALKDLVSNPRPAGGNPDGYAVRYKAHSRAWDFALATIAKTEGDK